MSNLKLAFLFPGQGSQKVGMLSELAAAYPIIEQTFSEASEVLGYDLWALSQQGPQEELNLTEKTQPLLLTSSVALWRVWQQLEGAKPEVLGGHSLGEFSALVCAGVLEFKDAVNLVRLRGQFMQTAVPVGEGAMAAIIGLSDEAIEQACQQASATGVVQAVNYNSPGQVVIAGHVAAVEAAIVLCKEAGAKRALPLPVSAPFHTELMKPAGEKLAVEIDKITFSQPQIDVVHNVNAKTESNPEKIKALMVEQIYSAVQWTSCVETMLEMGVEVTVECGPGKVLAGLSGRINRALKGKAFATEDQANLDKALATFQ
ncbi:Malonyl CoA-acyl carrier protein transacylase [Sinobacterium norvegicum]|uniref:Malonyl CoA-acyl carrier protein transacylase n=1 Tax=Sinobacterium norvegicum TaxID=1641715 RepID=A0ABM9AAG1_9GAMM|nr:ACP S-malonyltransferase [Sinobacterium norvegicum]CAH0990122.1 Malonyl CoA-acyl carrier protein transacylase [Sinobacterium norvegicum]